MRLKPFLVRLSNRGRWHLIVLPPPAIFMYNYPGLVMQKITSARKVSGLLWLGLFFGSATVADTLNSTAICAPVGYWVGTQDSRHETLALTQFMTTLAQRPVVLLGETHDRAEDHRWQLQTVAALYAQRPNMVLGFEMFPRRVQRVLDRWVAGKLTEAQLLAMSEWKKVWNYDASLYLPLFHFARMNRIPMIALNVDRRLTSAVREQGWDAVPEDMREGVSKPAQASQAYLEDLAAVFLAHKQLKSPSSTDKDQTDFNYSDPDFRRFVEGQLTWDRAMAEAINTAAQRPGTPLIVGILGAGHIMNRHGVPHQLGDLGIADTATLLTWERTQDCAELTPGLADAVFGVDAPQEPEIEPPRLGLLLEDTDQGVRVGQVIKGSVAESAGIRKRDLLIEIAGREVQGKEDVIAIVQHQIPGNWLPVKVKRGGRILERVAKFPAPK